MPKFFFSVNGNRPVELLEYTAALWIYYKVEFHSTVNYSKLSILTIQVSGSCKPQATMIGVFSLIGKKCLVDICLSKQIWHMFHVQHQKPWIQVHRQRLSKLERISNELRTSILNGKLFFCFFNFILTWVNLELLCWKRKLTSSPWMKHFMYPSDLMMAVYFIWLINRNKMLFVVYAHSGPSSKSW